MREIMDIVERAMIAEAEVQSDVLPKIIFCWPQPNGDHPTSLVLTNLTLTDAIIEGLKQHGHSLFGCTICDGDYRPITKLKQKWPGPIAIAGDIQIRIRLSPAGSWKKSREGIPYKYARYEVISAG